jgi:nucleotide-binding universal stress UspA family protein
MEVQSSSEGKRAMSTIVVGADGSPGAEAALAFAVEEARLRGADLRVVSAWEIPAAVYETGFAPVPLDVTDFERLAQEGLQRAVTELREAHPDLTITPVLRRGHPADVLVDEARSATLLGVGTRGLGGFRGLLLGSVSQGVAHHAPCPVLIVPHPS